MPKYEATRAANVSSSVNQPEVDQALERLELAANRLTQTTCDLVQALTLPEPVNPSQGCCGEALQPAPTIANSIEYQCQRINEQSDHLVTLLGGIRQTVGQIKLLA